MAFKKVEKQTQKENLQPWQRKIHEVIFEADTPSGKFFDVLLLVAIILSVIVVMLESISEIELHFGKELYILEWVFTILFSFEYILRLLSIGRPIKYARSFYGIIDLLSIVPTYLSLFVLGAQTLLVIRMLRLLRVFRVFKLVRFLGEASVLASALKASRHKIVVFFGTVLIMVTILGTLMYLIESREAGFTSIPRSIYWAIVTLTTVGYGDIAPQSSFGQAVAAFIMILGYSIIAIPTGIVSAEIANAQKGHSDITRQSCPNCSEEGHDSDATFCKYCGSYL